MKPLLFWPDECRITPVAVYMQGIVPVPNEFVALIVDRPPKPLTMRHRIQATRPIEGGGGCGGGQWAKNHRTYVSLIANSSLSKKGASGYVLKWCGELAEFGHKR